MAWSATKLVVLGHRVREGTVDVFPLAVWIEQLVIFLSEQRLPTNVASLTKQLVRGAFITFSHASHIFIEFVANVATRQIMVSPAKTFRA